MPSYKLSYFNVRFRPEITRLMFALTGTEFVDVRLDMIDKTNFNELRSTGILPLGQIPILEVGDRIIIQSRAIQRYVAREFGLYGSNNDESTLIDEVTETVDELLADAVPWFYRETDPVKLAAVKKAYLEESGPRRLAYLEKKLQKSPTGYFIGSTPTLADIAVFNILDILADTMPAVIAAYPTLLALKAKVEGHENIAKYIAQRPKLSVVM